MTCLRSESPLSEGQHARGEGGREMEEEQEEERGWWLGGGGGSGSAVEEVITETLPTWTGHLGQFSPSGWTQ